MTDSQWDYFCKFKSDFKNQCSLWLNQFDDILPALQKKAFEKDAVPAYPIETPIVYNSDLDLFTKDSDIKLIVIGDNPGKDEQRSYNRKYLCGQSGKIAEGFFRKNPELNIDFRKNAIILNKTPVHTAKTKELNFISSQSKELSSLIQKSQIWMAKETLELQKNLGCQLWLIGYAEIKNKGIFVPYRKEFERYYDNAENKINYDKLFVYQHFSMNRFLIDLKQCQNSNTNMTLKEALSYLGTKHKSEIFYLS
ncbi:MAG: hypothetical protein K6G52_00425 [Treponemataceae bacterium]|nr:hypothetical protein [Treponemataceae bacterium]